MPTDVDIGNMALSRLGTRATIADLSENSTEARALSAHYATVRDSILRARNWNFARINRALSLSGTAPARWTYSYAWPSDCLRFLTIDPGALPMWSTQDSCRPNPRRGFEIGSDGSNRFIWTDEAAAVAIYLQRVTDPNRYDPGFTTCFVDALAAAVAYPITQKAEIATRMENRARLSLENAAAESANEDETPGWADWQAEYVTVRGR